jgi:hypothetical protein
VARPQLAQLAHISGILDFYCALAKARVLVPLASFGHKCQETIERTNAKSVKSEFKSELDPKSPYLNPKSFIITIRKFKNSHSEEKNQ